MLAALTVVGLVGCSTIGESYMRLDYEGDDQEKVYACAVAAMQALETASLEITAGTTPGYAGCGWDYGYAPAANWRTDGGSA